MEKTSRLLVRNAQREVEEARNMLTRGLYLSSYEAEIVARLEKALKLMEKI